MFHVRASSSIRLLAAGLLVALCSAPMVAQEASSADLAAIEKALQRIAEVLDRQSRNTHASLLLSRLDIENRDLRSLDDAVASSRSSLRELRLEEQHLIESIDRVRDHANQETTTPEERLMIRRQISVEETRLESLQASRSDLEQRVIELENQAHDAALRRDALRAEVDEVLGIDPR